MISRALTALVAVVFALVLPSCARDVNLDSDEEPYPIEVKIAFRTSAPLDAATWYFMVFNFTAAPSTALATAPIDFISNEDRGANWELYVVLKRQAGGEDQLLTLQRPRVPTVLQVSDGPVDTAVADLNGDLIKDIAVACGAGNLVQMVPGSDTEIFNTTYFDDAVTIHEAAAPFRVHAAEMTEDAFTDLILLGRGTGSDSAYLRVLQNEGTAVFTSMGDTPVSGIPIDAVITDLNDNGFPDVALVTVAEAGGAGTLRIFLSGEGGVFSETDTASAGTDPTSISAGNLDTGGIDLVVGTRGAAADSGEVLFFAGDGAGGVAAPVALTVPGECTTVSTGRMYGDADDIVAGYTNAAGQHFIGVFHNETDAALAGPVDATEISIAPQYAVAHETGNDNRTDVVIVNGTPGSDGNTLIIKEGGREEVEDSLETVFAWEPDELNYLVGTEASRIEITDIDGNGVADLIMPNTAQNEQNQFTVGVFYGLGKANYTSADIYWTDLEPQQLILQDWYLSHTVGPNFFELTIDPGLFYDLARRPPDEFLVDFMTGTTGIDLDNNPDQLGEIRDNLTSPINIPMVIGHYDDEQNSPRANTDIAPVPSEDIVDWRVEVF